MRTLQLRWLLSCSDSRLCHFRAAIRPVMRTLQLAAIAMMRLSHSNLAKLRKRHVLPIKMWLSKICLIKCGMKWWSGIIVHKMEAYKSRLLISMRLSMALVAQLATFITSRTWRISISLALAKHSSNLVRSCFLRSWPKSLNSTKIIWLILYQ